MQRSIYGNAVHSGGTKIRAQKNPKKIPVVEYLNTLLNTQIKSLMLCQKMHPVKRETSRKNIKELKLGG